MLHAVIIKGADAIRIKGDTIKTVADSFEMREGATVENLLKCVPNFQISNKSEIAAQGQRVDKVLVNGKEFFRRWFHHSYAKHRRVP